MSIRLPAPERVIGIIKDHLRQKGMVDVRLDRLELVDEGRHLVVEIGYASETVWVNLRKGANAAGPNSKAAVATESFIVTDESRVGEVLEQLDKRFK